MNRRGIGIAFIAIAAFLFSVRYLTAGVMMISFDSSSPELFSTMLNYQGNGLLAWSIISLVSGAVILILEEIKSKRN